MIPSFRPLSLRDPLNQPNWNAGGLARVLQLPMPEDDVVHDIRPAVKMGADDGANPLCIPSSISARNIWFRDASIRKLNFGICLMFSTAASWGYYGGLVNSLLVLPYCERLSRNLSMN